MATVNAVSSSTSALETTPASAVEEMEAKAVWKRYEALMTVRTKAIKGKGAWYWAHLEPILMCPSESGAPKAVKLRCSLCDALFSASNPSRTASEHLKRGTCPNFSSPSAAAGSGGCDTYQHAQPKPISSLPPPSSSRKRSCNSYQIEVLYSSPSTSPILPLPSPQQPNLLLSGGKDDLGALAMLEDSVKKLKSPVASPNPALSKVQIDTAFSFLSDWFYECAGVISFSSLEHPKFRAFLKQAGLPSISRSDLTGTRLDARYEEARYDAEVRICDALFFQVAADGWKPSSDANGGDSLVSITVNLPNGTTVFHRALISDGRIPCKYAENVLWDAVTNVSSSGRGGSPATLCAGIVSDRYKSTALRSLEDQHHWMVNLSCQLHGFRSLIKDFTRDFPRGLSVFDNVASKCSKVAIFFNNNSSARTIFHKYQTQELGRTSLLRYANGSDCSFTVEDIIASTAAFHRTVHDDSFKLLCLDNPEATQLADVILDMKFWNEVQAVNSLIKLITHMIQEMQSERPLVGQCLPLWEELRSKIKAWCAKYGIDETVVHKVFEKRFKKNYHPAWSAAFILDPLYLTKDTTGKYLPPYKCLTPEQDKDVDKLITRLASREEAHIVLNELMKWRSEGMDPIYAQAVQVKQLDPATGKMKIANPQSSRLVWETCLSEEFGTLGKVAVRLIFLHATAGGFKCNVPWLRWLKRQGRSRAAMEKAQKMIFVAAQARLERRDFWGDEDKDGEMFSHGDADELSERNFQREFMEGSSV
ncbi:uncharacterized protein LOC110019007 [Phalaenopsis equestris]|uniref:uncharacterized protein LOC110019007 n=1 Tax=Phalaenopsis equestris TaxID=78828 RepID=UPI0009E1D35E|nr:uncharacterized protein LOC110019007 [Phalaenopsis equestris]